MISIEGIGALVQEPKGVTEAQHRKAYGYKATFMDSEHGAEVLQDLKQRFYERLSFEIDPHITAFYEGQRSVVIRILAMIDQADPEKYPILREDEIYGHSTSDSSADTGSGNYL